MITEVSLKILETLAIVITFLIISTSLYILWLYKDRLIHIRVKTNYKNFQEQLKEPLNLNISNLLSY